MKSFARFLSVMLCVAPFGVANAVVSQTAGNNLTAYNGESGSTNNNRWNTMMNARSGGSETVATADFGNCNAVIMRCASPKCGNGGCTDLSVTAAIVSGCIQSNPSCKQYGDDLIQYISAQLVANSTAKANAAANAASAAAANAAAQQNAQQMAMMQQQMQQMQSEMAAQNAQQIAQLQSALAEQKQLTANAIAAAAREPATVQSVQQYDTPTTVNDTQVIAAQNGVSADVLAREQISGQILSGIENSETQLKALKTTMTDTFNYAGCDSRGNGCTGPKRVKVFKQKAEQFFDPYESVLDEMYDALVLAQSVGVDITDIYMMLNGSCNVWGQYLCGLGANNRQQLVCDDVTVTYDLDGKATPSSGKNCRYVTTNTLPTYTETSCPNGVSVKSGGGNVRGGHECVIGQVVPPEDDISCTLQKTIVDNKDDPVQRDWLWAETSDSGANIRVGCASSALESSKLFRGRKKQASIDIETLQRMITQDAPQITKGKTKPAQYCNGDSETLEKSVETKKIPTNICIAEFDKQGTKLSCDDDNANYVLPQYALCSTHAYNIGETTNPKSDVQKQEMKNIIALKSTVMTQQMYKQYEYLESMIKRFKTQLEKAVLTTKLTVAGATDGGNSSYAGMSMGDSGSFKSNDRYVVIEGAKNCNNETSGRLAVYECLQGNINTVLDAVADNKTNEAKKQLEKDLEVAKLWGVTDVKNCSNKTSPSGIQNCAYGLRVALSDATDKSNNRTFQQNQNNNGSSSQNQYFRPGGMN